MRKIIQPIVAGAAVVVALATTATADTPRHEQAPKQPSIAGPGSPTLTFFLRQQARSQPESRTRAKAKVRTETRTPRFDLVLSQARWRQDVVRTLHEIPQARHAPSVLENARQQWF